MYYTWTLYNYNNVRSSSQYPYLTYFVEVNGRLPTEHDLRPRDFADSFVVRCSLFVLCFKTTLKEALYDHPLPILLNMLPYTSGYSTPVPSSSSLHFHASLPSHLSTELALLQTFIKRASAQHRSQLFLQRMEGILRVGKSMLLHVRKVSEERKGEACIAWRCKGENLIKKVSWHG